MSTYNSAVARGPQPVAVAQSISAAIPTVVGFLMAIGVLDLTPASAGQGPGPPRHPHPHRRPRQHRGQHALMHGFGTPWGFIDLVVMGTICGWLTVWTGGLESGIAMAAPSAPVQLVVVEAGPGEAGVVGERAGTGGSAGR